MYVQSDFVQYPLGNIGSILNTVFSKLNSRNMYFHPELVNELIKCLCISI